MRDLLELQTGQVAFLSGLLSGFSITAAMHIMRHGMHTFIAHIVFYISVLSSLLFLVALYVDVRLTIELAGKTEIPEAVFERVSLIRFIGTTSATIALCLFVASLGLLGWVGSKSAGYVTTCMTIIVAGVLIFLWIQLGIVSSALY